MGRLVTDGDIGQIASKNVTLDGVRNILLRLTNVCVKSVRMNREENIVCEDSTVGNNHQQQQ